MRIKTLIGKKVYDADANNIGKIVDAEFDEETYAISTIEISHRLLKKIHVDVNKIAKLGDSVFLKVQRSDIE